MQVLNPIYPPSRTCTSNFGSIYLQYKGVEFQNFWLKQRTETFSRNRDEFVAKEEEEGKSFVRVEIVFLLMYYGKRNKLYWFWDFPTS